MTYSDKGSIYLAGICSFLFVIAVALLLGWSSLASAQEDDGNGDEHSAQKPPPFVLLLTVHTPGRQPDQHRMMPMKSLEDCWKSAHDFMEATKVPDKALGISAGCGKSKDAEDTKS